MLARRIHEARGFVVGGFQRRATPSLGTRFSVGKSSVLYLCGADGSRKCSTPLNLCCISGVLLGKVAP